MRMTSTEVARKMRNKRMEAQLGPGFWSINWSYIIKIRLFILLKTCAVYQKILSHPKSAKRV